MRNELSRVVNAMRREVDGAPFAVWERRNFARSAMTVAAVSLIENWIDG